jgi:hypothetical protein
MLPFADRTWRVECRHDRRHEFCKSNEGKECYGWKVKVETMCYPAVADVAAKIHGAERNRAALDVDASLMRAKLCW